MGSDSERSQETERVRRQRRESGDSRSQVTTLEAASILKKIRQEYLKQKQEKAS